MTWRKSSYSFSNGNCVECRVCNWRKASRSAAGNCAEVGTSGTAVSVRDSRLGESSPVLTFTADPWRAFTGRLKAVQDRGNI